MKILLTILAFLYTLVGGFFLYAAIHTRIGVGAGRFNVDIPDYRGEIVSLIVLVFGLFIIYALRKKPQNHTLNIWLAIIGIMPIVFLILLLTFGPLIPGPPR